MKKYFVYLAAVAVMFATACNKEEIAAPIPTEFISVELNPMTKTQLNGLETVWSSGDAVGVYVGSNKIGTLTLKEGTDNRFEGNIEEGKSGKATLKYPADVTAVPTTQAAVANSFANKSALLEGSTTIEDLRAGNGATLENKTALLQFTVAKAGDVSFEVGSSKYTVTGCQTGKTYYACVAPASNASFVARIDGYLSKKASKNVTFAANKIANLGSLPAPTISGAYLKGSFNSWGDGQALYNDLNDWYVIKNFEIKSNKTEFKFEKSGTWTGANSTLNINSYLSTSAGNGGNIQINNGTYDFYFHKDQNSIYVTTAGSYAPGVTRPVRLLIKNNGKTAMNLYVWYSENNKEVRPLGNWPGKAITMTNKVTVNGTEYIYYEFDSTYFGKTMNYIINWTGGQTSDVKNVYWGQDNYYNL